MVRRHVLLLACAGFSWAPPLPAQTAADRETARLLMDRGDERVEQGDYAAALTLYLGAHEIMRVPTTGIEVARTYAQLGQLIEARETALEVLSLPVTADEPRPFIEARAAAAALLRELEGQIPSLVIELRPFEAARIASVRIDGKVLPRASLGTPHPLNPAEHRVEVIAAGFQPIQQQITLERGERRSLTLELRPAPAPALAQPVAPRTSSPRPEDAPPRERPAPGASVPWLTWAGLGLGGAGVIAGSVAGVLALDHASAAKEFCTGNRCLPEARHDRDEALRLATISNIGWAVAGVGLAVGVTSWLVSRPERSAGPVTGVGFTASAETGMVHWTGTLW